MGEARDDPHPAPGLCLHRAGGVLSEHHLQSLAQSARARAARRGQSRAPRRDVRPAEGPIGCRRSEALRADRRRVVLSGRDFPVAEAGTKIEEGYKWEPTDWVRRGSPTRTALPRSEVRGGARCHLRQPVSEEWGRGGEPPLPVYKVTLAAFCAASCRSAGFQFLDAARACRRFARRPALGTGPARLSPPASSERHMPHRPLGDHGRDPILRLLQKRQPGAGDRTLLDVLHGDAARPRRSLSLVGKLYPTLDPNHAEPLRTASFITQQDLGGERRDYINDAELRNAPDTRAWRRGLRRAGPAGHGRRLSARRQGAVASPALRDRRARQAAGRGHARAGVHAPAGRAGAAADRRRRRWISATRSWRRSSTRAIRSRGGRSCSTSR